MRLIAFALAVMATFATFGTNPADTTDVSFTMQQPRLEQVAEATQAKKSKRAIEPAHRRPLHFALKTNMLLDAALMPNIELQWLVNDKWSAALEADVAWWKPDYKKVYRIALISPEVRYHFRQRAQWHGMYVGAFAGGGLYQLEWKHDGYKGEGFMAGLSFGYMWPIRHNLSLEAGIGAGYMHTRYKVYDSLDGHKLYMRTKSLNYFGPLKLRLSLAWRFDIMAKKK